jgi:hypothetical protein
MLRVTMIVALAAAVVGAAPAGATVSRGFTAVGAHCAAGVPHIQGLLCSSAAIEAHQYDGEGVVQLLPTGKVTVLRAGSDLLLSTHGNRDHTGRPPLRSGATWKASGFSCARAAGVVTCRRDGHGFSLSAHAFRRF